MDGQTNSGAGFQTDIAKCIFKCDLRNNCLVELFLQPLLQCVTYTIIYIHSSTIVERDFCSMNATLRNCAALLSSAKNIALEVDIL